MAEAQKKPTPTTPVAPAPPKPVESKAERFRRLGSARLPKAVKAIDSIANLAQKGQYEYTPEQVQKITDALNTAVRACLAAFAGKRDIISLFQL